MMPFLLDEVAQLHYDDMLRESEARQRAKLAAPAPNGDSLYRHLRKRSGQFFIAVGAYLVEAGTAASNVRLDQAS